MYIQLQPSTVGHACISDFFEDQKKFLLSLANNNVFKIFLDDVQVYTAPNPNIGRLAGIKIAFTGAGMMCEFSLKPLSK